MKTGWWKKATVYQIYPRSFCDSNGDGIGDLNGIRSKLDYLKELGVDVIWLSPIYKSPMRDNGYDISDYLGINPEFGTMADFDNLLSEAHALGLKIVMDMVVNHSSDKHPWFIESRSSYKNSKRDYYIWRDGKDGSAPNNWESCFGGPAWSLDEASGQYFLHSFSPFQPDLNLENPALRNEIYNIMRYWLNKGIDGFRMDAINYISKPPDFPDGEIKKILPNGPRRHEYIREMRREVFSRYDIITIGEAGEVTVDDAIKYASLDGSEMDMVFQFEAVEKLDGGDTFKWNDRRINLVELKEVLSRWQTKLFGKAWNSLYWCNHDQPRIVTRLGDEGEYREKSAKMLAICLHFMQGTPYIYQGEELGMTNVPFAEISNYRDIESINAYETLVVNEKRISKKDMLHYMYLRSRDNSRTPMQWNSGPNAGFSSGNPWIMLNPNYREINVEKQINKPDSVFAYYKKIIQLRKELDIITYGNYKLLLGDDPDLFVYIRQYNNEALFIACNFSYKKKFFDIPGNFHNAEILITNETDLKIATSNTEQNRKYAALEAFGAVVFSNFYHGSYNIRT